MAGISKQMGAGAAAHAMYGQHAKQSITAPLATCRRKASHARLACATAIGNTATSGKCADTIGRAE